MRLSIYEICDKAAEIDNLEKRRAFLKKHDNPALRAIFRIAFSENTKWLLPAGNPPYQENDFPDQEGMLYANLRKLNIFLDGGPYTDIKKLQRENLFIQFLETLDKNDAKLILSIKDGEWPWDKGKFRKDFLRNTLEGLDFND
jgi:hypothetical protein